MTLWGGRFEGSMSDVTREFTGDTSDRRLLEWDIRGSIAHVTVPFGIRRVATTPKPPHQARAPRHLLRNPTGTIAVKSNIFSYF